MINKQAVQEFLDYPRDDNSWIKTVDRGSLENALCEICQTYSLKTKLFLHQLAAVYLGVCFPGYLFFLDMGSGKEQPLDSKILTPAGWKTMGEMKIGMEICHPTAQTSHVIGVYPQGFKDVYKVTFTDGSSTECGLDHLWTVQSPFMKWKNKGYKTLPLSRIKETIKQKSNNLNHFIPMTEPVHFEKNEQTFIIHPYALGCLIGDGSLTTRSINLTKGDTELFTLVEEYLPETLEFSQKEGITQSIKRKSETSRQNSWTVEVRRLGLNTKSNAKHIPSEYLFSSIENRTALLQGLMDTDGYVSEKGGDVEWSTSSEKLCEDFIFLVQSLGGTAYSKIKVVSEKNYWIVRLLLPNTFKLFRLNRKKLRWEQRQGKYQPRRGIMSVEFVGRKECQCISVDNSDGLYITDDFIVTHNTLAALTVVHIRKQLKQVKKTLVVVPNAVNVENWLEEIKKHTSFSAIGLVGTKDERAELLKTKADLYVINYEGLPVFMTDFQDITKKRSNKANAAKRKRVINTVAARQFARNFDMLILDELHHIKHEDTLAFQLCSILSKHAEYRLGMTGTPIGRDPINFWAQFFVIDQGETLGSVKSLYLQALFKPQHKTFGFGVSWVLPEKQKPVLQQMLLHRSLRYADYECNDLPALSTFQILLTMPPDTLQYYKSIVSESIEIAKSPVAERAEKRKNCYTKCRQVASGFVYETSENTKVKEVVTFSENPKLDALEEILEDIPNDCKVVIFHVFNQTGKAIGERLKKIKFKYAAMNVWSENDKTTESKRFKEDPTVRALVVNIASGGEGLNLQVANYCIFVETTERPDARKQALKRTHRTGQQKHCYVYDLVMKNTVELKILQFLEEGKNLFSALVEGTESLSMDL